MKPNQNKKIIPSGVGSLVGSVVGSRSSTVGSRVGSKKFIVENQCESNS